MHCRAHGLRQAALHALAEALALPTTRASEGIRHAFASAVQIVRSYSIRSCSILQILVSLTWAVPPRVLSKLCARLIRPCLSSQTRAAMMHFLSDQLEFSFKALFRRKQGLRTSRRSFLPGD